jgi:nitroreductase
MAWGNAAFNVQRSPSGFNMVPYAVVIVDDTATKGRLADACLGGNAQRVLDAAVTAVFAADLQPYLRIQNVIAMERDAGKSTQYLRKLEFDAGVLTSGCGGETAQHMKSTALRAASLVLPTPSLNSIEAWSFKNTMLAAQTYMLAATSYNLATHPMEGFDASRVRQACDIPARYGVPVIISTGYSMDLDTHPQSPRPKPSEVFRKNSFATPFEGISDAQ